MITAITFCIAHCFALSLCVCVCVSLDCLCLVDWSLAVMQNAKEEGSRVRNVYLSNGGYRIYNPFFGFFPRDRIPEG